MKQRPIETATSASNGRLPRDFPLEKFLRESFAPNFRPKPGKGKNMEPFRFGLFGSEVCFFEISREKSKFNLHRFKIELSYFSVHELFRVAKFFFI
jgi:hypothetical protein